MTILCFTLGILLNGQSVSKPPILILDFEARSMANHEVASFTDDLRKAIDNTQGYTILDKSVVEAVFAESGGDRSNCYDVECGLQNGRLLGAEYIIVGFIEKEGNFYTIGAQFISAKSGKAEREKILTYEGDFSGIHSEMSTLGWTILGLDPPGRDMVNETVVEEKMRLAILDFTPQGIVSLEAQTLTHRFAEVILKTGKVDLYDRETMATFMVENGYDESGCGDVKCIKKLGRELEVPFMISGSIEKVGDNYGLSATLYNVIADSVARKKDKMFFGDTDRLISEVEMLAWEILGLPPPDSLKRKSGKLNQLLMGTGPRTRAAALTRSAIFPGLGQIYLGEDQLGYAYITSSLVITLFAMRAHNAYKNAYDDVDLYYPKYRDTKDPAVAKEYRILSKQAEKLEVDAANEYEVLTRWGFILWMANLTHTYVLSPEPEVGFKPLQIIDIFYNPKLQQPQLRFSIALD